MGTRFDGSEIATTRAGDGYERRAFTADEIYRMEDLGIIDDDEGFELIEGDIVMMQSKNAPHERIKLALVPAFSRTLPDTFQLGVETSLIMGEHTIVEPDLSVYPMQDSTDVRGPDVLLAIEVADTTLRKDLRLKALLYAKYGVHGVWVINARELETTIHKQPVDGTWSAVTVVPVHQALTPESAPGFAIKLGEL